MSTQEKMIAFAIVMFVLSQISERVANLLKLWLPAKWVGNLDIKEPTKREEKIRERKIMLVSVSAGAIVAGMFIASGKTTGSEELNWVYELCKRPLVFLLVAIFLSFGSKFWHDVLDILFAYKNAQRVLRDPAAYRAETPAEINEMLARTPRQTARAALNANREKFQKMEGVTALAIGDSPDGAAPTIRVYFKTDEAAAAFPGEIVWTDEKSFAHHVEVQKIVSGAVLAQAAAVGGKIYNVAETANGRYGTMGFVFQKGEDIFASSCYHVMRSGHDWLAFQADGKTDICHAAPGLAACAAVSTLVQGFRTQDLDLALARVRNREDIDRDSLPPVKRIGQIDQHYEGQAVVIKSQNGLSAGIIHEHDTPVEVLYSDGSTQWFRHFFSIRMPDRDAEGQTKCPTVNGDSGSAVYNDAGEALGIIVGGSKKLAYAMKVSVIEDLRGISLFPRA